SHAARNLLLGQAEIVMELVVGVGLFHRIQIFALDVFDEGDLQCVAVVMEILNYDRDALQAGLLRGAKSALAGDQPKLMIASPADNEWLHDAVLAHTPRKFIDRFLIEFFSRLKGIRRDAVQRNLRQ